MAWVSPVLIRRPEGRARRLAAGSHLMRSSCCWRSPATLTPHLSGRAPSVSGASADMWGMSSKSPRSNWAATREQTDERAAAGRTV